MRKPLQVLVGGYSDFARDERETWVPLEIETESRQVEKREEVNGERTAVEYQAWLTDGTEVRYKENFFSPHTGHASNGAFSIYSLDGKLLT